jgi:nucleoside-diphosphate-sugar epimerase
LEALGVEQVQGDVGDADSVSAAARGCDIVFHVAAKAGVWGPRREYDRTNVDGTANVIAACRKHSICRLVFTSSPSVTFDGVDQNGVDETAAYARRFLAHYPRTKAMAEQAVLSANGPELATVALRPHLIWGPGDPHLVPRLVARAKRGSLRRIGNRAVLVDTTYVDNAALAHILASDRLANNSPVAGRAYFISQGEPGPLWEFIDRLLAAAGLPPVRRRLSSTSAYLAGAAFEMIYRLFRFRAEPPITRFVARQLSTSHWFDLTAARRDLGYVPLICNEEGLRRLAMSLRRGTC